MNLYWNEQNQPYSMEFGDIYFSTTSGLKETEYVFIKHNDLSNRFKNLCDQQHFVIGETGFGTGLNFLCAWHLFNQIAPSHAYLSFISVEKFPLSISNLTKALQLWPELAALANLLLDQYPMEPEKNQALIFDQGRITLQLLIGDALQQYSQLNTHVDAWFLDGFSPAKNPDMWSHELFKQLARLSTSNTTLATFTSAGHVRRGLIEAGFYIEKTKGFGNKREMCFGHYQAT